MGGWERALAVSSRQARKTNPVGCPVEVATLPQETLAGLVPSVLRDVLGDTTHEKVTKLVGAWGACRGQGEQKKEKKKGGGGRSGGSRKMWGGVLVHEQNDTSEHGTCQRVRVQPLG